MAVVRQPEWIVNLGDAVADISWAPDSTRFAVATVSADIALFTRGNSAPAGKIRGHEGGNFRVAWSPSDPAIATSGQDGTVRLWNPTTAEPVAEAAGGAAWIEHLKWSPNGEWLASAGGKQLKLWQRGMAPRHDCTGHSSTISGIVWNSKGTRVAASSYGGVQIWNVASGERSDHLPWKTSLISVAWAPDERWIVAGTQELSVQIWPLPFRPGEELAMSGYTAKVRELSWHHSGRYLATGGGNEIMVWDCSGDGPAGKSPRILKGHQGKIASLDYQRAGHVLASGGTDGAVFLWNAGKVDEPLRMFQLTDSVGALQWSPDGAWIAAGTRGGQVALLKAA